MKFCYVIKMHRITQYIRVAGGLVDFYRAISYVSKHYDLLFPSCVLESSQNFNVFYGGKDSYANEITFLFNDITCCQNSCQDNVSPIFMKICTVFSILTYHIPNKLPSDHNFKFFSKVIWLNFSIADFCFNLRKHCELDND